MYIYVVCFNLFPHTRMSLNPLKQFGYKLRTTTQDRQRLLNQTLKSHGLTHAQYMVMQYLYRADQKKKLADMSQSQIAQSM
jgi:phosphoglycolate phosphatase-like HAD superfamily hydrolase